MQIYFAFVTTLLYHKITLELIFPWDNYQFHFFCEFFSDKFGEFDQLRMFIAAFDAIKSVSTRAEKS